MVEMTRKDIIITAYSIEEVATPIWSDFFSECGLKFSHKTVVFHYYILCLFYVSTAQVDVVTVPASPSIVMLWPLLRRSVATPVPSTAGI
jgi:hypothetical protein